MTRASNDNTGGYIQAMLVLVYPKREEYREMFAASVAQMQAIAERIFEQDPDLLCMVLWREDEREALVFNGPKRND